jgi:preprotein translocase subunit SecA
MPGRRWSDGLHQAIEAKESVKIERENQTLATVTFQNYFRMYKKLSGMTGTAETEAAEFGKIYALDVVSIPTNRNLIRLENPDIVYRTEAEKYHAVVNGIMQEDGSFAAGIKQINEIGQPVLVGTISIEKSEQLAEQLKRAGVPHQILNAKQHERESRIIAQAGRKGAVTVATNMAGRGTDILLGGNPEFLAREYCLKNRIAIPYAAAPAVIGALPESAAGNGASATNGSTTSTAVKTAPQETMEEAAAQEELHETPAPTQMVLFQIEGKIFQVPIDKWQPIYDEYAKQCKAEHDEVVGLGGLHILGTERHEARRIDNQLRGRAGRQGDPGSSRFFLSLEDDLMRIFGGERIKALMYRLGMKENVPIESKMISKRIENSQKEREAHNFEMRKHLLEYDDVMNKQRETIYSIRRSMLEGRDQKEYVLELADEVASDLIDKYCPQNEHPQKWETTQFAAEILRQFGVDLKTAGIDPTQLNHNELIAKVEDAITPVTTSAKKNYSACSSCAGSSAASFSIAWILSGKITCSRSIT